MQLINFTGNKYLQIGFILNIQRSFMGIFCKFCSKYVLKCFKATLQNKFLFRCETYHRGTTIHQNVKISNGYEKTRMVMYIRILKAAEKKNPIEFYFRKSISDRHKWTK